MAAFSHKDFINSLVAEFPDLRDELEQCDGLLQAEMETFAAFTQAAKTGGDLATYERCVTFADRLFAGADAALAGAFRASFLEHLEFEGSKGPAAWRLMPVRLQSVWNQIAAENRRLQALPQKHAGQKSHDRDFGPRPSGGASQGGRERGKKRPPRRGRRR
jgi:hypothetical protein